MADFIYLHKLKPNTVVNYNTIQLPIEDGVTHWSDEYIAQKAVEAGISNFNFEVDKITADLSRDYDEIDFGGLTITGYYSAADSFPVKHIKKIKNLNIKARGIRVTDNTTVGRKSLQEFEGDIEIQGDPSITSRFELFSGGTSIMRAKGKLVASGITRFCIAYNWYRDVGLNTSWYNVLDLRNIDTSYCTYMIIGHLYKNIDCTIILGNFSNERAEFDKSQRGLFMGKYAGHGEITVVMTTDIPPVLKNCAYIDGLPQDQHEDEANNYEVGNNADWVSFGGVSKILVPKASFESYNTNTYINNGTVGNTGWSYYGTNGKNIIETYEPGEYEPRDEWLYRKED